MTTTDTFSLLHDQTEMTIAKLSSPVTLPSKAHHLYSLSVSHDELSIVAPTQWLKDKPVIEAQHHWQVIKIDETLDFSMVGVLANMAQQLAQANISIFVVSTFNTDYLLVQNKHIGKTLMTLRQQGHSIRSVNSFD